MGNHQHQYYRLQSRYQVGGLIDYSFLLKVFLFFFFFFVDESESFSAIITGSSTHQRGGQEWMRYRHPHRGRISISSLSSSSPSSSSSSSRARWASAASELNNSTFFAVSSNTEDHRSTTDPRRAKPNNNNNKRYQIIQKKKTNNDARNNNNSNNNRQRQRQQYQFHQYLRNLNRQVKNRKTLANRLDDELKTMERKYYNSNNMDPLFDDGNDFDDNNRRFQCRYPNSVRYDGPIILPDISCYAIVANAYAKAGLGKIGAQQAEAVYQRYCCDFDYNDHRTSRRRRPPPNTILRTAVANAWIQADQWDKADEWFQLMEDQFQRTGLQQDAPDTVSYTHYLEGLSSSIVLPPTEIYERGELILQKMMTSKQEQTDNDLEEENNNNSSISISISISISSSSGRRRDNPFASPNRYTYIAAMKCRARKILPPTKTKTKSSSKSSAASEAATATTTTTKSSSSTSSGNMEIVKDMEELLREMELRYNNEQQQQQDTDRAIFLKPNCYAYIPIANAAAKCGGGIEAAHIADRLLLEQKYKFTETNDEDYLPLDGMYTACFTAYARVGGRQVQQQQQQQGTSSSSSKDRQEASQRCRHLFRELETERGRAGRPISVHAYTAAINGIVIDPTKENLEEATRILRSMPVIDSIAYQCVIHAYAKSGDSLRAEDLLWELQEHAMDPSTRKKVQPPDVVTVAACINSWVSSRHVKDINEALDHAGSLLELITTAYLEDNVTSSPPPPKQQQTNKSKVQRHVVDPWVFENVIRLWSVSRREDAGEQAERLIEVMQEIQQRTTKHEFAISYNVYTLALDAWATSRHKDAGSHAIKLLQRMQELADKGEIEPLNNRALSTALVSITKSTKGPHAVDFSLKLMNRIVDLYTKGDRSAVINARTFTTVLSALARSNESDAVEKAIDLMHQVRGLREQGFKNFELNTIAYNSLLNLLARRGLAEQAEELVEEMNQLAASGHPCAPDTVSWSCVCRAYANSNNVLGENRTLDILAEVEEEYSNGNERLKPDAFLYNAVLTTLARAAQTNPAAAERAYQLLSRMELSTVSDNPISPDLVSYCSVAQAFAVSTISDGSQRADEILERAENLAAERSLPYPDAIFYSSLAFAFTRNKVPNLEKAESIIQRMEELHGSGRCNVYPTTQTYNHLLSGWAQSRAPDKLKKTAALLRQLKERASSENAIKNGPDIFSYNWVILAAAHSPHKSLEKAKESFQIALDVFREVHNHNHCHDDEDEDEGDSDACAVALSPNSFTYSYFLKACNTLLPAGEERDKLMMKAFILCQQRGLVSQEVWTDANSLIPNFLESASEQLEEEGTDTSSPDGFVLPDLWTRNLQSTNKLFTL